jgi:hypothetical protein
MQRKDSAAGAEPAKNASPRCELERNLGKTIPTSVASSRIEGTTTEASPEQR